MVFIQKRSVVVHAARHAATSPSTTFSVFTDAPVPGTYVTALLPIFLESSCHSSIEVLGHSAGLVTHRNAGPEQGPSYKKANPPEKECLSVRLGQRRWPSDGRGVRVAILYCNIIFYTDSMMVCRRLRVGLILIA